MRLIYRRLFFFFFFFNDTATTEIYPLPLPDALPISLEVFARQHRQLMLAAGPELLPLVIEPPQPPAEPSGGAFEEGAAQPGVALEDSAGGHASDGPHQLDWIANGMGDRVEVGVPDEAPPGIVLERGVAGRMKSDRYVELLERDVPIGFRSEEHTSELQSLAYLVCRLLLEKKKQ